MPTQPQKESLSTFLLVQIYYPFVLSHFGQTSDVVFDLHSSILRLSIHEIFLIKLQSNKTNYKHVLFHLFKNIQESLQTIQLPFLISCQRTHINIVPKLLSAWSSPVLKIFINRTRHRDLFRHLIFRILLGK